MQLLRLLTALILLAMPAAGEPPRVVADIAPVHSLVAAVMQGAGTPDLLVRGNDPAHGAALRPSQARALQGAQLVVWIGPELTPWLEKPLKSLAKDARSLPLLHQHGTRVIMDPETGGADPHAWLDPENAQLWLDLIAARLGELDPPNATLYRANAASARTELARLQNEIAALLRPMRGKPYVTYHDAYRYFENRFALTPVGALMRGDAAPPGPARLARLRDSIAASGASCAFAEAGTDPALLFAVVPTDRLEVIELDPSGRTLEPGPDLYPDLLRALAAAFADCAGKSP